jgi:hypothetical protein
LSRFDADEFVGWAGCKDHFACIYVKLGARHIFGTSHSFGVALIGVGGREGGTPKCLPGRSHNWLMLCLKAPKLVADSPQIIEVLQE